MDDSHIGEGMKMRELSIITFVTLDGVMQGPSSPEEDPTGGFTQGGWAADYWPEVMEQVMREAMAEPYSVLFGRKTYEIFAAHWPAAEESDPVARILNQATKYVATNSLVDLEWENSIAIRGDILSEVTRLKAEEGPVIQIHGSGALIQTLLAADLIDEIRLWTFPVILGSGRRLFGCGASPRSFQLKKTEACSNGTIMTIYRRS